MDDDAAPEDDELGPGPRDQLLGRLDVDAVRVVLPDREVLDRRARGHRVDGDIVSERAGGLGAQVPALVEVVHQHAAQQLRHPAAPAAVLELLETVVDRVVGHLAGDHPHLGAGAAEEGPERRLELLLLVHDEAGALVVAHLRCLGPERLETVVLVVAPGRVGRAQPVDVGRAGLLRRDQVDARVPSPAGVDRGLLGERRGQIGGVGGVDPADPARAGEAGIGPGVGRRGPKVLLDQFGRRRPALVVDDPQHHRPVGPVAQVGVDERQPDRAQVVLVGRRGGVPLAVEAGIGHGRARGHVADPDVVVENLEPGAQGLAPGKDRDRLHQALEQARRRRRIQLAAADVDELVPLGLERRAADVVVGVGVADREQRQRVGEDRDVIVLGVEAQLVAVQGQPRLQAQRIAGTEADRHGAGIDQALPQRDRLAGLDEQLEADRLAGIAGARDDQLGAVEARQAQLVALVLGQLALDHDPLQDGRRIGALQRDHAEVLADVGQRHVARALVVVQPAPVLVAVAGVDDQEEARLGQLVEIGVVDRPAGFVGDEAILGLAGRQRARVVGERAEQEALGARARDLEAAHMGDVEQAGVAPGRQMLLDRAGLVLHRHVPASEVDQLGAVARVPIVEHGPARGSDVDVGHGPGSSLKARPAGRKPPTV